MTDAIEIEGIPWGADALAVRINGVRYELRKMPAGEDANCQATEHLYLDAAPAAAEPRGCPTPGACSCPGVVTTPNQWMTTTQPNGEYAPVKHTYTPAHAAPPVEPDTSVDDLVARLRDHKNEGVTGSDRFWLREDAAARLSAQAAEIARLREALRRRSVSRLGDNWTCTECWATGAGRWREGEPENHATGCLAALGSETK